MGAVVEDQRIGLKSPEDRGISVLGLGQAWDGRTIGGNLVELTGGQSQNERLLALFDGLEIGAVVLKPFGTVGFDGECLITLPAGFIQIVFGGDQDQTGEDRQASEDKEPPRIENSRSESDLVGTGSRGGHVSKCIGRRGLVRQIREGQSELQGQQAKNGWRGEGWRRLVRGVGFGLP